jgi:hypothetical protein
MRQRGSRETFSIRNFLLFSTTVVLLGFYINSLWNGENSLQILIYLNKYEKRLIERKSSLQKSNQKLQKEYFELIKLNGY